jgi:hypothetical protein
MTKSSTRKTLLFFLNPMTYHRAQDKPPFGGATTMART